MPDSLRIALRLLTRLPVPAPRYRDAGTLSASLVWYPLVGGLLGMLLWALAALLSALQIPVLPAAALLLAGWVALTGALHLDGLADMADAWLGGMGNRQRTLDIMKDPCTGPAGVTVLVLVLLLKFAALSVFPAPGPALLLAVILGRTVLVGLFLSTPYVRPGGMGEILTTAPRRKAGLASLLMILPPLFFWPVHTAFAVLLATAVFLLHRHRLLQRLGGTTGDTAGALVELTETVVLTGLVLLV